MGSASTCKQNNRQVFACTVDLMHAFEAGVVVHVIKAFVAGMSTRTNGLVDKFVDLMFGQHCSSETDTYPHTNFSKGCTDLKLLHAFEWPGLLVVFLVLTQTYAGLSLLNNRFDGNDEKYAKRVQQWEARLIKKGARTALLRTNGHRAGFANATEDMVASDGEDNSESKEELEDAVENDWPSDNENKEEGQEKDEEDEEQEEQQELPRCTVENFVKLMDQLLTFHAYYKHVFLEKG